MVRSWLVLVAKASLVIIVVAMVVRSIGTWLVGFCC